jgi:hypothetical protein
MRRWLISPLLAGALLAGEPPARPEYLKRKPETKTSKELPGPPKLADAETSKEADAKSPAVVEMKVERSASGNGVSAGKPATPKSSAVHGEVRAAGANGSKASSGQAVVQDKRNGKWAITAGTEKIRTQPRR